MRWFQGVNLHRLKGLPDMAKRRRTNAISATDAPATEATPVPADQVEVVTVGATQGPEPEPTPAVIPTTNHATRTFRVKLFDVPAVDIQARDEAEAFEAYKERMGILATVHTPTITEVK